MKTGVKLRAWRELLRQLDESRRVGQLSRCIGDKTQQAVRSGSLKLLTHDSGRQVDASTSVLKEDNELNSVPLRSSRINFAKPR